MTATLEHKRNLFAFSVRGMEPRKPPHKGWRLIDDATKPLGMLKVEAMSFHWKGEDYVDGWQMCYRAKSKGANLGERHARALLKEQRRIPRTLRKFYFLFPGTRWRDPESRFVYASILRCDDGQWNLRWVWLGNNFDPGVLVLRLRR